MGSIMYVLQFASLEQVSVGMMGTCNFLD